MNIAWFTPFNNRSAIGKVSKQICEELMNYCYVAIWTHDTKELFESHVDVIYFDQKTNIAELEKYDYIVYNMGNFARYHKEIFDMSQRIPGIIILHDQTMHSFFREYYLMPEFGGNSNDGFNKYRELFKKYYGKEGEIFVERAYDNEHYAIYDFENMPDYKLIQPVLLNAIGVFTHANFFTKIISEYYNGPIGYSYLPCEVNNINFSDDELTYSIINNAKKEGKVIIVSNGIVHSTKHIDKVVNVLCNNKDLANDICYIVIGSYGGEYGNNLEKLSKGKLKDSLHMLGYQDDNVMYYALQNADLCINLRYPNSEVCSLSLFEQMSFGKPTLVLNSGIYNEIPDDCVVKITLQNEEDDINLVLNNLIEDSSYYYDYGKKARIFISDYCNIQVYCTNFLDFLKTVNVNSKISNLQNIMIDDISQKLYNMNFTEDNLPSTLNNIVYNVSEMFNEQKSNLRRQKIIGVWAGFQYHVPNLQREGITRFMVYMINSLINNYSVEVEVWSYSFNENELRESFDSILGNYKSNIKFITEKNWNTYFEPNLEKSSYNKNINEINDNLSDLARDYSNAECFIPLIMYLDSVIGTEKQIFVPAHDMAVAEHYYEFIVKDPLNKFSYLDISYRAENLARNGAVIFSNCKTVMHNQILKYIKNIKPENTSVVYLPVNIPGNIDDLIEEKVLRKRFKINGRYMFYPTQIRPYKNVSTLIKAFNIIKNDYKDLTLVLTGNPTDLPEVSDLINEFNLSDRINLVSSVTEKELYSIYKYAAAVPVPSIFEGGFPWQACEALFMNVPLVLTNIPIVKERIEFHNMTVENCGLELFDPYSEEELAKGLKNVLANRESAVKKQSLFREALLSYSWDDAAKMYYNLFFNKDN